MNVIAFHTQHDANLAISRDGELALVIELERLFEERYFASAETLDGFRTQWQRAIAAAQEFTGIERFDVAVTSWVMPSRRRVLAELVAARHWVTVDHHRAHALHAFYDAPFDRALVVSMDGGGNDGTFHVFRARSGALTHLRRVPWNLGTPYRLLATAMAEVTGGRPQPRAGHLALAGKVMAYAALGEVRAAWIDAVDDYYRHYQEPRQALYTLGEALGLELEPDALTTDDARALAATSQHVFESLVLTRVRDHLAEKDDGVVLTGGCALNVRTNERVRQALGRPVHVPPAPNDAGIAVGALWAVAPPRARPDVFVGLPLSEDVGAIALERRGARRTGVDELAALLSRGAVIGVARGRAELGPRALGHRSILALPDDPSLKERINARIKSREWYRPLAPAVPLDRVNEFVCAPGPSPHMSFAMTMHNQARVRFPAAAHVDGTARVQTAAPGTFMGELLAALDRQGRAPIVLNTSLNTRGRPLVQRASAVLAALDETALDYAWIDGWLVPRDADTARRFAGEVP
ncbi:carbamoyltransferase C-terminal domain-containing protein [Haliangium ochraceum]|uniref:Carbamoyltransferase n=1 Tax=Haliangium ochraceum (strain DSM 14365 / JCM 11303 / SMP-2) TaxID=502025 RepID=D0LPT8_HALO1|nr:carbamoyltransferase C-terminal domain-containing protein [Haliangium ochraceum]ACY15451.1 Carbamoyltransferase [Haliangium ochraceum DSM 14365]